DGVIERLLDALVLEERTSVVEVDELNEIARRPHDDTVRQRLRLFPAIRDNALIVDDVNLARLELRVEDWQLGDDLNDDAVELGRPEVVIRVALDRQVIAADVLHELERSGADWRLRVERGDVDVRFLAQDVMRD